MERIYSRVEIIDGMCKDLIDDIEWTATFKKIMLQMDESDFMKICEKENISLERFIKNRYYLKRCL